MRSTAYARLVPGLIAIALMAIPAPAQAAATTYSGQATVVRANVLGTDVVLADTGPLPEAGGAQEASLLTAAAPGLLSAEVLHASTVAGGGQTQSEASVAELDLTVAGNTVSADFLMSRASARCGPGGASTSASSEIVNLVVNGQAVTVSGDANQTIALPVGMIVINEQQSSPGGMTVRALHIVVPGVADVVISEAHAGIHCGSNGCAKAFDFVTGGGWITAPSGGRGTVGVAGGVKNGAFWGHLTYHDHGTGLKVKGTAVTGYAYVDPQTRRIDGLAEINGAPGTYTAEVRDAGEPGRSDTFTLRLSTGYTARGPLTGGNIQLHNPRCA